MILIAPQYEQIRTNNKTLPQVQSRDATPTPSTNASGKRKRGDQALSVSSDSESDADADTANKTPRKKTKRDAPQSSSNSPPPSNITVSVLLAQTWKEDKGCDPTGYWISEKLDGVRCVDIKFGVKDLN
jgi:DNA ligase 1